MTNPFFKRLDRVIFTLCIYSVCYFILPYNGITQTLPSYRAVDWTQAGLQDSFVPCYILSILDFGADSTGVIPANSSLNTAINMLSGDPGIIFFPAGEYFFNTQINLPSNCVIRGEGADQTVFTFDLGGGGNCFHIQGNYAGEPDSLSAPVIKNDMFLITQNTLNYEVEDYIFLYMDDAHLLHDAWAANQISHLVKIVDIVSDTIFIDQMVRLNYPINYFPRIRKVIPKSFVGIENLKIIRADPSAGQTKNIFIRRAVNCWVKGIESDHCNFGHVVLSQTGYSEVSGCHFHEAFDYGTGGKAYGIVLETGSNLNRIDNNIFNHLRHSMLLQTGANGNVVAYNYSTDPFWSDFINNAAGDIVLHGNYPFSNLFEGNVVANIRIDASHGINGPFNTFLRNRAELYGLIMSSSPASDSQNILGSEITLPGFFYGNFILEGSDHFNYGNNVLGDTEPAGTNDLSDISYGYQTAPTFLGDPPDWPFIGYPLAINEKTIPADNRYNLGSVPFTENASTYAIQAVQNIWTGCNLNNNWHDLRNWSKMQLPSLTTDVQIKSPIMIGGFFPRICQDTAYAKTIEIISPTHLNIESPGYLLVKELP